MFEQIQNALLRIIGLIGQKCLNTCEDIGQQGSCPFQIMHPARCGMKAGPGCPAHRTPRGFLWSARTCPLTVRCTRFLYLPFFPGAMLMRTDDRGIDHRVFVIGVSRQMLENPLPHAVLTPYACGAYGSPEISEPLRKIPPGNPGAVPV